LHYNINLKKAVLFIGLPGSGKTTIVNKVYGDYNIVSADIIKSTHRLWSETSWIIASVGVKKQKR
jgi:adenylate kinase family enzyme